MYDKSIDIWTNIASSPIDDIQDYMFHSDQPTELKFIDGKVKSILDYGCGLGRNFQYLKTISDKVYGYDIPAIIEKNSGEFVDQLLKNKNDVIKQNYDLTVLYFTIQFFCDIDYLTHIINKLSHISNKIYIYSRCYMEDSNHTNIFSVLQDNPNIKLEKMDIDPQLLISKKYPSQIHFECVFKSKNCYTTPIVINCDNHGYGDCMTMAWIAEGSKMSKRKILLHATGDKSKILSILEQDISPKIENMVDISNIFTYDQKEIGINNLSRLQSWLKFLSLEDVIPTKPKYNISNNDIEFANKYCDDNTIVLCPESIRPNREWPAVYWMELADKLRKDKFNVIFICSYGKYFSEDVGYIKNLTWSKIVAIFTKTKLVIGCDSAPIHLTGITNTLAIALLGPTTKEVFNHLPLVSCISINEDTMPCVGCWFQGQFQQNPCSLGCVALSCITPNMVYDHIIKMKV